MSIGIKVVGVIDGETLTEEKSHQIVVLGDSEIAELPEGILPGINYHQSNNSAVTLALEAPGKEYVFVVGDFTNWEVQEAYKMKKTADGETFWLDIEGLTPQQQYVFQYWIDGEIKIADSYAEQIADPWNDKFIEESVFPNLPDYRKEEYGLASVLQTGQVAYEWSENESTWEKPDLDHLVIYELLVRDFLDSHSYIDLIDTIQYLKSLGIGAIELMPVNEFEGNESWGYNPSFYFAPDKYYGTKDALKQFIDVAHQNGMAVIMDIVLNHAFGSNSMVRMYWDNEKGQPATDNPWFNAEYV